MKTVLILGMGRFGIHLAQKMTDLGNEVMVVDKSPEIIESLASRFSDAHIGDCTNEGVLRALGVNNFDLCFVTIGEDSTSMVINTTHIVDNHVKPIEGDSIIWGNDTIPGN